MCRLYVVIILVFSLVLQKYLCQFCSNTTSYADTNDVVVWVTPNAQAVVSNPICLNKNYEIVKWQCQSDGQWFPKNPPKCVTVQKPIVLDCPSFAKRFHDHCYYISDPQPFTNTWPLLHISIEPTKYADEYTKELEHFNIDEFWLPLTREEPFAPFVSILSEDYQNRYTSDMLKDTHVPACMIMHRKIGNHFEPKLVNCSSSYRTVSIFDIRSYYFLTPGQTKCDTRINNKCYYWSSKSACKLAEPQIPEENFAIKELMTSRNVFPCRMGLGKDANGMYKWFSSESYVNYTDWIISTNFANYIGAISNKGWSLHKDDLKCSVCEIEINFNNIGLTLRYNANRSKLVLTAYGPQNFRRIKCAMLGLADEYFNINFIDSYNEKITPTLETNYRNVWELLSETSSIDYCQCTGIVELNSTDYKVIKTAKKILLSGITGGVYALEISVEHFCRFHRCDRSDSKFYKVIVEWLRQVLSKKVIEDIRPKQIINIDYDNGDIRMLLHLHTNKNDLTDFGDYMRTLKIVEEKVDNKYFENRKITIYSLKSCMGCMPGKTKSGREFLVWGYTQIGTRTTPKHICFQSNSLPVTRVCAGNYMTGAEWLDVDGHCAEDVKISAVTSKLLELWTNHSEATNLAVIKSVRELFANTTEISATDIYQVSQILANISEGNSSSYENNSTLLISEDLSEIINSIIGVNSSILQFSNRLLNSTNHLVDNSERVIKQIVQVHLFTTGIYEVVTDSFMYQLSDPVVSNITGIAIYKRNSTKHAGFRDYDVKPLTMNTTLKELVLSDSLELAAYVPESLMNDITSSSENIMNAIRVSVAIYYNDSLFNANNDGRNVKSLSSPVISLSVENYDGYFPSPIPIVFKSNDVGQKQCVFWDFGTIANASQWTSDAGVQTSEQGRYCICKTAHLTHFGYLLGIPRVKEFGSKAESEDGSTGNTTSSSASSSTNANNATFLSEEPLPLVGDQVLDVLTNVGCFLSIIGICGIFITAGLFESWRQKIGNKILLNVSFSTMLQMAALYFADMNNYETTSIVCTITGAILHYAVLCAFAWTLVSAMLQYFKFIRIITVPPAHLLLKTSIVGWILPIILVLTSLIMDSSTYVPEKRLDVIKLCYPQGMTLVITVYVPIIIITLTNLFIFCSILFSLMKYSNSVSHASLNATAAIKIGKQLKLAVLLFFMLGLTWIFGLLAASGECLECLYLFCATATLQGFIMFLFFVVLDPGTRRLWVTWYKNKMKTRRPTSKTTMDTNTHDYLDTSTPIPALVPVVPSALTSTYYKANIDKASRSFLETNMQQQMQAITHRVDEEPQSTVVRRTK